MKFLDFFTTLGYSEKDAQIWKTLYRLGTQSASVVARESGLERTYTYKTLSRLVSDGLVSETEKNGVSYFFVPSPDILRQRARKERERYAKLEEDYSLVEVELSSLSERNKAILPKIQIYEGTKGMQNIYADMLTEIEKNNYRQISLFASNILEQSSSMSTLSLYAKDFLDTLLEKNIAVDTSIGNGISLLEAVSKLHNIRDIEKLPASGGSVQIWIIGESMYITLFKQVSFGMKIMSNELSNIIRFLIEKSNQ